MHGRHGNARSGAVGALIVIGFGVIMLLNQNGILAWHDIWRLWPIVFVLGGLVRLTQPGANRLLGGLMIVVGLVLEASEFHLIPYRVWDLWPLGIIALGLLLLWQSLQPKSYEEAAPPQRSGFPMPLTDNLSFFGGGERRVSDSEFTRAELVAIFGGYKLDLRKATMKGSSAVVDATAIFGGIEIIVPRNWNVVVRGVGIFGGYGDETEHVAERAPELIVQGVAIFGGVAIKN